MPMTISEIATEGRRLMWHDEGMHNYCTAGNCRVVHDEEFFIPLDSDDYEMEAALDESADMYYDL